MSEKKYYVKLKSPNNHKGIWWCGDRSEWQPYSYDPVYGEELDDLGEREVIGWKVSENIPAFTKSELAEIMDGALYKEGDNPDDLQPWAKGEEEYINPLIKLVPVEDGE